MHRLKLLSAGAVKRGVTRVVAAFETESGQAVDIEFSQVPVLRRRLADGECPDVVVATPAVLDEAQGRGQIDSASRGFVGRSRVGIVVHADAPDCTVADVPAFKAMLMAASHVVRNDASSGLYIEKLLDRLDLTAAIGGRLVVVTSGAAIMQFVADHPPAAVGLAQISELMVMMEKGCRVRLAAPLPDEIQNLTHYDVAAVRGAAAAATALAQRLASPEAKKIFAETGIS